ncbi:MAG: TonB-dependent siderophore receptor [Acidobacteriaceae bacterium]|nr:TonB-dependent siderophore receptor [Acidobacteriaceae bacterium]
MSHSRWPAVLLTFCSFISSSAFAQNEALEGAVSDPAGARIGAATLILQCPEASPLQAHSDAQGHFTFPRSGAGCTLQVAAIGFSTMTVPVESLHNGSIVLSVKQVSNSVTVNADSGYVAVASSTATKTDTPISEVPQEISVVTRDQMDVQASQSVPEALRYSVGMLPEVRGISTGAYEVLTGRGFQMEEYLDGMRLPNAGAGFLVPSFDPFDLQSIEVLHGPASVLFGQAYPAGLANMVSKQPRVTPFGQIDFTPGNYDRLQGDWDFGGPLDKRNRFLYRVVGLARHTYQQVDFAEQERYMLSPTLSWRPDGKTSLTVLLNWQYDPHVGFYNLLPASGTVTPNPNGIIPTSFDPGDPDFDKHSRRQYAGGYLFSRELGAGWNIQQNFRYFHLDDNFQNIYTEDLRADGRTIDRYSFVNNEHIDAYTLDTHAAKTLNRAGVKQTILMGVDYQSLPYDEAYGFDFTNFPTQDIFSPKYGASVAIPSYAGDDVVKYHQTGVYGQDQLQWKRLALTLGGREDWTRTHGVDKVSGDSEGDQSNHAFTGRAGLVYLAGHGISPYYSYSTSFQPQIGTDQHGNTFNPTTGEQHEAGIKYQPGNFNGFFTLSVYDLNEHNVLTTDPSNVNFSVQAGAVRSRGMDLDAHANLAQGLSVIAGYSLLQNMVTDANNPQNNLSITKGKAIYGTPRNQLSFWTDYAPQVRVAHGVNPGGGVRFVGRTFGDDANSFTVPSSTLVDAMARYSLPGIGSEKYHWQLSINATNITDKRYVSACLSASAGCFYGQRRNILGTVGMKW